MQNKRTAFLVIVALLISVSICNSETKREKTERKRNEQKSRMEYTPIKYNLLVNGNIGYILISDDDISSFFKPQNKIFYGFGVSGEYHTEGKHAFSLNYNRLFYQNKVSSTTYSYMLQTYTVGYIYKFRTKRTTIPIFTFNFGTAKPDIKQASSAKTFKIGLGFIGHTGSKSNLKTVAYFQRFTSSDELDKYIKDGKLDIIGLDVYWGIPL